MKAFLLVLLLTGSAFAQSEATSLTAGCGPRAVSFQVRTDKKQHPLASPEPGKALVYIIQDDNQFQNSPKPTTRIGVDGYWVGATHGDSYFYLSVEPGSHNLCADWQSSVLIVGRGRKDAAIHFDAEAGQVYYFRVEDAWQGPRYPYPALINLRPADPAQAHLLMSQAAFCESRPK
jgi:hypothetical protein